MTTGVDPATWDAKVVSAPEETMTTSSLGNDELDGGGLVVVGVVVVVGAAVVGAAVVGGAVVVVEAVVGGKVVVVAAVVGGAVVSTDAEVDVSPAADAVLVVVSTSTESLSSAFSTEPASTSCELAESPSDNTTSTLCCVGSASGRGRASAAGSVVASAWRPALVDSASVTGWFADSSSASTSSLSLEQAAPNNTKMDRPKMPVARRSRDRLLPFTMRTPVDASLRTVLSRRSHSQRRRSILDKPLNINAIGMLWVTLEPVAPAQSASDSDSGGHPYYS